MNSNLLFFFEFVIFSGIALVWAIREYLSVSPGKKPPAEDAASPDDARHPEG